MLWTFMFNSSLFAQSESSENRLFFGFSSPSFNLHNSGEFADIWNIEAEYGLIATLPLKRIELSVGMITAKVSSRFPNTIANFDQTSIYSSIRIKSLEWLSFHLSPEAGVGIDRFDIDRSYVWKSSSTESELFTFVGGQVHSDLLGNLQPFVQYRYIQVHSYFPYTYQSINFGLRYGFRLPPFLNRRLR